jgi:hypothetical protein
MYHSLAACCDHFHLYIVAFDDTCYRLLKQLALKGVTVIPLGDFEDEELLEIKPSRSRAEYCWTCSSSVILYCLERFDLPQCTYIDADLYFYSDPEVLLEEMEDHSVLITEHRYSPQYEKGILTGKYCVQFNSFRHDSYGMKALKWWRDRCIEWCYARHEDGKFGDQKYLDDWTTRFEKVWVMQNPGGGLAAWNVQQYSFTLKNGKLWGKEISSGKEFPAVFYHFHYVRFYENGLLELGRRTLSRQVLSLIYKPYIAELMKTAAYIRTLDAGIDPNGAGRLPSGLKHQAVSVWRKIKSVYHIYPVNDFLKEF